MKVVHLMASPFLGGPERQALGLARHLPAATRTTFLSFAEGGRARPLLEEAKCQGFEAIELRENAPHFFRAANEVAEHLRRVGADLLLCSGYKPDLIGWLAARRVGIPAVAIAHGWTAATFKVRLNEALDRWVLRRMACTVCVSEAMAVKVRRAGVPVERVDVICNAIDPEPFERPDPAYRGKLLSLFAQPPAFLVGAAGRLSPEKGFDLFIEAAARVARQKPDVGFVLFGAGPLREALTRRIAERGLEHRFILGGFCSEVHRFLPHFDVVVLSSHSEGLPVVVLEALAAGVPVVATAVGGTPEVIDEGVQGYLVAPGDPNALADRILRLLQADSLRHEMGGQGRLRVRERFSFAEMAARYQRLFDRLTGQSLAHPAVGERRDGLVQPV
jgi:glycosyltransferase involved in cell wall biosynthesis